MKRKQVLALLCVCAGILLCGGCKLQERAEAPRQEETGHAQTAESGQGQTGPESGEGLREQAAGQAGENDREQDKVQGTAVSAQGGPSAGNGDQVSADNEDAAISQEAEEYLGRLTLEEKAAQLFIILPESLMKVDRVTAAGETTRNAVNEIPVGGFIYMAENVDSADQVKSMLSNVQAYSLERLGLPAFLSIDEEGGTVTRISGKGKIDVPDIGDMEAVGRTGDADQARQAGSAIGAYLADLGFNVDFAPVADVLSNPDNTVVKQRSFGSDPQLVSDMSLALAEGLGEHGIISVFKHFPGHGGTAGDTHEGYAFTDKTLEELLECELIPFQKCIDQNAGFIMVGHISLPNVTGGDTPASLSPVIIDELLRGKMGYDGIVVTDALDMAAIADQYSPAEAAVKVLLAGADLILMPENFEEAYEGVINAVKDGTLSAERLDQSLRRILKVKLQMKHSQEEEFSLLGQEFPDLPDQL